MDNETILLGTSSFTTGLLLWQIITRGSFNLIVPVAVLLIGIGLAVKGRWDR